MAKILIVDDDPAQRARWKHTLELEGHTVQTAVDAIQGLINITRDPPALILSDILMPRMDGFTFIREVKSRLDLRAIPFLFVTSTLVSDDDRQFAQMLGAEAIITRADEAEAAQTIIAAALKRHQPNEIPPLHPAPFSPPPAATPLEELIPQPIPGSVKKVSAAAISRSFISPADSLERIPSESQRQAQGLEEANAALQKQIEQQSGLVAAREQLLQNLLNQTENFKTRLDEHAQFSAAINEITRGLNQQLDPKLVLTQIVQHAANLAHVDSCSIFLFNSESSDFQGACSAGLNQIESLSFSTDSAGSLQSLIAEQRAVALCPALPHRGKSMFSPGLNARAAVVVPIVAREQVLGLMIGASALADRLFTEEELEVAALFAEQAGLALGQARLLSEAHRALPQELSDDGESADERERGLEMQIEKYRAQAAVLSKISRPISTSLFPQEVLHAIVQSAVGLVRVETCNLFLFDTETNMFQGVTSSSMPADTIQKLNFTADDSAPMLTIFQNHTTLAFTGVETASQQLPILKDAFHAKAALVVPVIARSQVLGVLLCVDSTTQRAFSEEEIELLTALADQAALWLEAARWYYEANRQPDLTNPQHAQFAEQMRETASALNEPLVAILDQTQTLLEQSPSPELRLRLEGIETNTRRIVELADQLRRVSPPLSHLEA